MTLCDAFSRLKQSEDVLNIVWLLFHLFGLSANLYACCSLKKKWNTLGSFKLLLATSIFSNVFALVVHLYLPINFMLRSATGLQWSFGSFLCTVLPPVANFALAASTLSLLAVALEHYFKTIYKEEISLRDAENTTVLIWVIASIITAPQFCQCGSVSEPYLSEGNCIQVSRATYSGRLYESSRLVLQYAIPFALIANSFIKIQIYPHDWRNHSKIRRFLCILVDILIGVFLASAIYFFPVRTVMSGRNQLASPLFPDIAAANQVLEFIVVFCCIAAPFELIEILNDEHTIAFHKTTEFTEKKSTEVALEITKEKLPNNSYIMSKEKPTDEFLISLINEEPLRLKNEIVV